MSTDIKSGQVWEWYPEERNASDRFEIVSLDRDMAFYRYLPGRRHAYSAPQALIREKAHLVESTPATEPEPVLPTTVGSVVLVRGMGGNAMSLQLRPDRNRKPSWLHALGNPWIEPIVRDHLIEVLFDAGESR